MSISTIRSFVVFGLLGFTSFANAQLQLVTDIHQGTNPGQSSPDQFTQLGAITLFAATSGAEGRELWKTDGTEAGTVLVKDIRSGSQSSSPRFLATIGSTLYFSANDGNTGAELWKTDGTEAGTVMVKDIMPGIGDGCGVEAAVMGTTLIFAGRNSEGNTEVWKSDGTSGGTELVRDIRSNGVNPGSGPSSFLTVSPSLVLFIAEGDSTGRELYKTDGTLAGTVLVKDILTGSSSSTIQGMTLLGSTVFFGARDSASGYELWKSDGTNAGTVLVRDIIVGAATGALASPGRIAAMGGHIYFTANSSTGNPELFKSDGTSAGTVLLKEINASTAQFTGGSNPTSLTVVGSTLYFMATDGNFGVELWKSDGTNAGTVQVKDIQPGTGSGGAVPGAGTPPTALSVVGSTIYFYATDGTNGGELWKSDGTSGGTVMVKDYTLGAGSSQITNMRAAGSSVFFSAIQPDGGTEPVISNGMAAGTGLLSEIGDGTADSSPSHLVDAGGRLFFSAVSNTQGRELWVSDSGGAHLVVDLTTGTEADTIRGIANVLGTPFFGAEADVSGGNYALFTSDGTALGTRRVGVGFPGPFFDDSWGGNYQTVGNRLYYIGETTALGQELWVTDGTPFGTYLVKELGAGSQDASIGEMESVGNNLYLVVEDDVYGRELWKSTGTAASTVLVKDIVPDSNSDPYGLTPIGSFLYFGADGATGSEIYRTTGTAASTRQVGEINEGGSSFPNDLTPLPDGTILFSAFSFIPPSNTVSRGTELWKYAPGSTVPVLVKDIAAGTASSLPSGQFRRGNDKYAFAVMGGYAYFSAETPSSGRELWRSDGSDAGTTMVKDIMPGADDSNPMHMVVADGALYFSVNSNGSSQIWMSDGTDAGTVQVDNQLSSISSLTLSGDDLYVVGTRSDVGLELFKLAGVRTSPFTISQHPMDQNITPGSALDLSIALTAPVGTLTQWRRNGIAIPGATSLTYRVAKASEANEGTYDVLIRSGDYETLTDPADVLVGDPPTVTITSQPQEILCLTGATAVFQVAFSSQTSAVVQWFRGSTLLPGETNPTLTLTGVTLSDAGQYQAKITNSRGTVSSKAAQLAVVESATTLVPAKINSKASAKLRFAGTGLKFLWQDGSNPLSNGGGIGGVTTSALTFSKVTNNEVGNYNCRVMLGSQAVVSGLYNLQIASAPIMVVIVPQLDAVISQNLNISVASLLFQNNFITTPWNVPTSFTVSGLLKGLKYDPVTMSIVGRPIDGIGLNTLTITAFNVAGPSSSVTVNLAIAAFPTTVPGEFRAVSTRDTAVNANLGNAVQFNISAIGVITGKVFHGKTSYGFTGAVDTLPNTTTSTATISVPRKNKSALQLTLNIDHTGGQATGSINDGAASSTFTAHRANWSSSSLATSFVGANTAVFQISSGLLGDNAYPQGDIILTATVTSLGVMNGVTHFPDGTRTTFSILLGNDGSCSTYISAWLDTGSLLGDGTLTSGTRLLDGTLTFFKANQPASSTTRSFKSGFPLHNRTLIGGPWVKPTPTSLLLGVSDPGTPTAPENTAITFTYGGIEHSFLAVANQYTEGVRIKAPASTLAPPPSGSNPGKLTISLDANTGEFSGTFSTLDPNPVNLSQNLPRTANFKGVFVQRINKARGYFNLPLLPAPLPGQPNANKTEIPSGLLELIPDM
ncbi:MAG: hypothetical protein JNJ83_10445 [Verrucomicrobiaceae bacterium]|nr:hypothetical protein [Verrucomicrobiaceae bacterium]